MPFLPGEIISANYGKVFDELATTARLHPLLRLSVNLLVFFFSIFFFRWLDFLK